MKETVKINLSQRLFDLDADAYTRLKDYLDALTRYFSQKSPHEAEEIIQDIEQRIADLLAGKLGERKQVINLADVEDVIAGMGTIEDFNMEEGNEETSQEQRSSHQEETYGDRRRQLYRDLDNNLIGGVCSGIGAYFSIDPNWIRVVFVILFLLKGFGLLAYLILWAVVPAARTTAQKLSMKGRPVNVENIENAVKEEFVRIKDNVRRFPENESFKRAQSVFVEIFEVIGRVFLAILKIVLVLVGVAFAFAGLALLMGVIGIGTPFFWHVSHFRLFDHFHPYMHNYPLLGIALLILLIVPVVAIIGGTIRFIFNGHHNRKLGVGAAFGWTLWALALVFVIILFTGGDKIFVNRHVAYKTTLNTGHPIKTLYIGIADNYDKFNYGNYYTIFGHEIVHDKASDKFYLQPRLAFRASENSSIHLQLEEVSNIPGSSNDHPWEDIQYDWKLNDSLLLLQKYFSVDDDEMWFMPGARVIIFLPEGQKVYLHKDVREMIDNDESDSTFSVPTFNQELIMTDHGLIPLIK